MKKKKFVKFQTSPIFISNTIVATLVRYIPVSWIEVLESWNQVTAMKMIFFLQQSKEPLELVHLERTYLLQPKIVTIRCRLRRAILFLYPFQDRPLFSYLHRLPRFERIRLGSSSFIVVVFSLQDLPSETTPYLRSTFRTRNSFLSA